jgi:hypothetical protein
MRANKLAMVLILAACASHSLACSLQVQSLLGVQPGSEMSIQVFDLEPDVVPVEGGASMLIDIDISFFDVLFGSFEGDISVGDVLIAAPGVDFLGFPEFNTGTLCVVPDPDGPGGGTFEASLFQKTATFDVAVNTVAMITNPLVLALIVGGNFDFPFSFQSSVPFGLADMLGILGGGGPELEVTEPIDQELRFAVDLDGPGGGNPFFVIATVGGTLTMATVDAFPSSPLLDDCIEALAQ